MSRLHCQQKDRGSTQLCQRHLVLLPPAAVPCAGLSSPALCTKPFSCALCPREDKPVSELPLTGEESKAFLFSPSQWVPGTQPTRSYPHTADTGWNMRVNSGLGAIQVRSFVQHQLIHIQSDPISSLVSFVQTIRRTAWPSYPFTAPKNRG